VPQNMFFIGTESGVSNSRIEDLSEGGHIVILMIYFNFSRVTNLRVYWTNEFLESAASNKN